MKPKHYILLALLMLSLLNKVQAQVKPGFAHFNWNPMPFNCAFAGNDEALNLTMSSRVMWTGIDGAPRTHNLSAHTPLLNSPISLGVMFYRDEIGVQTSSGFRGQFAYKIKTPDYKISFGISMGYLMQTMRWSEVVTTTGEDIAFGAGDQQSSNFEIGTGILFERKKIFAGLSIPSISKNSMGHLTNEMEMMLGSSLRLSPQINLKSRIRFFSEYQLGIEADISQLAEISNKISVGMGYRTTSAWIFLTQIKLNGQLALSYSFDYYTGKLNRLDRGTHDFTMIYIFKYNSHSPDTRMIQ